VLTRPRGLSDELLTQALRTSWNLEPVTTEYCPLGFGSHHWHVAANGGSAWFVTVDDLTTRLRAATDTWDAAYQRLRKALRTARALSDTGAGFVVAPVRTTSGDVLTRIGVEYAIAVYPHVRGQAGRWGDTMTPADRQAILSLLTQVHAAPRAAWDGAGRDDFLLAGADHLRNALGDLTRGWDGGPYAEPARRLLARHARDLDTMLARRDRLAGQARAQPERLVLTHGEPHPGNFIRTGRQWMLIDWDTVLLAPPERDLWHLDPGDGSIAVSYRALTGREILPSALDLYRQTWVLADIASSVTRLRGEHGDTGDDRMEWEILAPALAGSS
jgi:aminoglycoside phosphotransferase (APT) family kinase protein